jgi:hypothetical protein
MYSTYGVDVPLALLNGKFCTLQLSTCVKALFKLECKISYAFKVSHTIISNARCKPPSNVHHDPPPPPPHTNQIVL